VRLPSDPSGKSPKTRLRRHFNRCVENRSEAQLARLGTVSETHWTDDPESMRRPLQNGVLFVCLRFEGGNHFSTLAEKAWRAFQMATFVLVHGAWQTASTWDLVVPKFLQAGHRVVVPRLRGLENEGVALSSAISLRTHIDDVREVLAGENLDRVVLVGHSYAGMVITGVAEQMPDRLDRLVYVDAFVPDDGQSVLDLLPSTVVEMFRQVAGKSGAGWRLRGGESQLDMWGLKPGAERDFVQSCLSDFSLRCFEEAVRLPTNAAAKIHRTFLACTASEYPARSLFQRFSDRARSEGWAHFELPTGHDCHVEQPEAFVSKLLAISSVAC
jgi:pimeloyl-ACP methyl ester carboxylesterase